MRLPEENTRFRGLTPHTRTDPSHGSNSISRLPARNAAAHGHSRSPDISPRCAQSVAVRAIFLRPRQSLYPARSIRAPRPLQRDGKKRFAGTALHHPHTRTPAIRSAGPKTIWMLGQRSRMTDAQVQRRILQFDNCIRRRIGPRRKPQ